MINVNEAIAAAQERNRKCWLEHAGAKLSGMIMSDYNISRAESQYERGNLK